MKHLFNKYRLSAVCNIIALATSLGAGVSTLQAQERAYSLTDLGTLPGKEKEAASPAAINDQGQVAGNSGQSAFRYQSTEKGSSMEDLSRNLAKGVTRAFGINGAGQVVGDSTVSAGRQSARHAVIFQDGSVFDLGVLKGAGAFSRANSINVLGQVVGFAGPTLEGASSKAFIWSSRTGMLDLGTLGGAYAQAWGINDSGFVTGNSQTADESTHAFLWESKTGMVDLGTLAGNFSYGTFVNAINHVVGYSTIDRENDRVHAFLFDGKTMQDLGSLSAGAPASDRSYALGVNDSDEVVGHTYLPASDPIVGDGPSYAPRQVAFIYRNGVMTDLNNLIGDAAKRYQLYSATAINNKGQIAALAFDSEVNVFRAVVLTPAKASGALAITDATYWVENQALVVQATASASSSNELPVLDVRYTNGQKLGTLDRLADGSYGAKLYSATNPQEIVVVSSLGDKVQAKVQENAGGAAAAKR